MFLRSPGTTFSKMCHIGSPRAAQEARKRRDMRQKWWNNWESFPANPCCHAPAFESCWHGEPPAKTTTSTGPCDKIWSTVSWTKFSTDPKCCRWGKRCSSTRRQSAAISHENCAAHSMELPMSGAKSSQKAPIPSNKDTPMTFKGRLAGPWVMLQRCAYQADCNQEPSSIASTQEGGTLKLEGAEQKRGVMNEIGWGRTTCSNREADAENQPHALANR